MASDAGLGADLSSELMDSGTDAFGIGLDHDEPAPDVKQKEMYEDIMGISGTENGGGNEALSKRLISFREWLEKDGSIKIHPSLCLVNGEATDGTKNAPVLVYGPPPGVSTENADSSAGRIGIVDREEDRALYDRTMGCQVRSTKEIKKDDILLTVPRSAMITPDLVAASDAGRAVLACCEPATDDKSHFWSFFENTTISEKKYVDKVGLNNGTQLLVKILQHRKKAETAATKSLNARDESLIKSGNIAGVGKNKVSLSYKLAPRGIISTRAPILAFLIHQRFSDTVRPPVVGGTAEIRDEMDDCRNGGSTAIRIKPHPDWPLTFGPYARILPSTVPIPLCWKRNELALLAGCVPGIMPLQEVAGMTLQLASEFVSLVDAGILHRFPSVFPRGLITWERWVWAASVYSSRVLPASCYFDRVDDNKEYQTPNDPEIFQSNSDVWNELGVMIPFLDMLNHETDAAQVTWQPALVPKANSKSESNNSKEQEHPPRAICHKRVKKGSQLYCSYGSNNNQILILQYGFGLINNASDEVRVGWGLTDAVGNVKPPDDYMSPFFDDEAGDCNGENITKDSGKTQGIVGKIILVCDSAEAVEVNNWWTKSRLEILDREALLSESILSMLGAGKKMISAAYHDVRYHPALLSAAVVATIEADRVEKLTSRKKVENTNVEPNISITKSHQKALRRYLAFFFARKMEKMLQSLNNGLKGHFEGLDLWTKASNGGLAYSSTQDSGSKQGWNKFFEEKAYFASVEAEKHYFTLSPESCVLALYDGHLRALQASIDGLVDDKKFENVISQLEEIGYKILENDDLPPEEAVIKEENVTKKEESTDPVETESTEKIADGVNGKIKEKSKSKRSRRNRKRSNGAAAAAAAAANDDRPPAIKLHIGNLAYCTLASDLFEYFAATYGRENVLECHIPTERESGRSRGFGFVTMTEGASRQALQPGKKHEVHGRMLKIAESNSAGSANRNRGPSINAIVASDRCGRCGYRPRYCVCAVPDIPAFNGAAGRPPPPFHDDMRGGPGPGGPGPGHEFDAPGRGNPEFDHYGGSYRREQAREFSNSPPRPRGGSSGHRDREYQRHDRDYNRHRYSRSRSYSPRRERDRSRRRSRDRDRGRHRDRERTRSRDRRRWEDRSRSSRYSRSRSESSERSRSPRSPRRERDRERDHERRNSDAKTAELASGSRERERGGSDDSLPGSLSPGRKRDRETRKRSRSRSRGRSGRRKRSSKKEGKKHNRDRSPL
mmetsp:Transcript_12735/g.18725  ORF Transcript_12735/g.18725 Transcript_12735/m.18725 type:complete len:1242 (-) Transcript_12735:1484-5209(-)